MTFPHHDEEDADRAFANMVPSTMHLNADKTVAVSNEVYWNEDMTKCPTGVKVQLLGKGGVAVYAQYQTADQWWVGWAPLPKRRPRE